MKFFNFLAILSVLYTTNVCSQKKFDSIHGMILNQNGELVQYAEIISKDINSNTVVIRGEFTLFPNRNIKDYFYEGDEVSLFFWEEFSGLKEFVQVKVDNKGEIIIRLGNFIELDTQIELWKPKNIPLNSVEGQKIKSQVEKLYNYINFLSDNRKGISARMSQKKEALKFFKENARIQVSNNRTGDIFNRTVDQYLTNLIMIKSDVNYFFEIKEIKEVNYVNNKYWINADLRQYYEKSNGEKIIYRDITDKQIQFEKSNGNYLIRNIIINDPRFIRK